MNHILHKELSDRIIGLALTVHHTLGPGLLESAYQEAMCWELQHSFIPFDRQKVYPLNYKGDYIGGYIADIVVDNKVILQNHEMILRSLARETRLPNCMSLRLSGN